MEALLKYRDTVKGGKEVEEEGDSLVFADGSRLPKTTTTAFFVKEGEPPLSLGDVFAFRRARAQGKRLPAAGDQRYIPFLVGRDLEQFLGGKKKSSKYIVAARDRPASNEKADESSLRKRKSDDVQREGKAAVQIESTAKKAKLTEPKLSPQESLLKKIQKREGVRRTRNSVLMSNVSFQGFVMAAKEEIKRKRKRIMMEDSTQNVNRRKRNQRGCPIIVVPAALTSPITMYNVRAFLEEGKYVKLEEAKKQNPIKEPAIYIEKRLGDIGFVRFKIVDSVKKFQDSDWERLAAVITHGPKWQFKDWIFKDTATIFSKCRGLHVYFDDNKLEPHIKTWNVVKLPLKKQSRHEDSLQQHRVWGEIERFLSSKKPDLLDAGKVVVNST